MVKTVGGAIASIEFSKDYALLSLRHIKAKESFVYFASSLMDSEYHSLAKSEYVFYVYCPESCFDRLHGNSVAFHM